MNHTIGHQHQNPPCPHNSLNLRVEVASSPTDTALKTANDGYLTRWLADIAQGVILSEKGLRHYRRHLRGADHRIAAGGSLGRRDSCSQNLMAGNNNPATDQER